MDVTTVKEKISFKIFADALLHKTNNFSFKHKRIISHLAFGLQQDKNNLEEKLKNHTTRLSNT